MSASLSRRLRDFVDNRSGNFAIATAAASVAIMMGSGLALNAGAMMNAKARMQSALDAALTSTARDITTGRIDEKDARAAVERFLSTNRVNAFGGVITLDALTVDRTDKTLTGTISVATPNIFPMPVGLAPARLSAQSTAVYSDKKIEVSMVLDITGSMKGAKIADLKKAAKNAVGLFLDGQDPADPRVRIALTPYATAVNAGPLAEATVYVEASLADRTAAPGNGDPKLADLSPRPDACATERKGAQQFTDAGPENAMVNRDFLLTDFAKTFNTAPCPDAAVMPLTADAAALQARIASFKAEGGTGGHIGIQWGRYLLSPKWKNVLPAKSQPENYHDKKVAKYAIVMTDGEFNLSYFDAATVADIYDNAGKAQTRASAVTQCEAMQDDGVEVFTIGFMLTEANAKATMKDCASADTGRVRHHYEAATGAELDAAFREIAANIEKLAITQ